MSKDLEKEYKNLIEQETEDFDKDALWTRIEAALPEKAEIVENLEGIEDKKAEVQEKATSEMEVSEVDCKKEAAGEVDYKEPEAKKEAREIAFKESEAIVGDPSKKEGMDQKEKEVKVVKWYRNKKVFTVVGTLAAACLLGIIVLNGMFDLRMKDAATSDNYSGAAAPNEVCEEAPNYAPEAEVTYTPGRPAEDMQEEMEYEGEGDKEASGLLEGIPSSDIGHTAGANSENDNETAQPEQGELTILENMVITPTEQLEEGCVCEVINGNDRLIAGEMILIVAEDSAELVVGAEYPCTLRYLRDQDGYKVFSIY